MILLSIVILMVLPFVYLCIHQSYFPELLHWWLKNDEFFLSVLRFELRALCFLGGCSTAWAKPLNPFLSGYFGDSVHFFCPGQPGLWSSYFTLPTIAGITGACHHTEIFPIEMGFSWTFLAELSWNRDPLDLSRYITWDDRHMPPQSSISWDRSC
jgi:hypothetical protein